MHNPARHFKRSLFPRKYAKRKKLKKTENNENKRNKKGDIYKVQETR